MQMKSAEDSERVWFVTGASSGFGHAVSRAVLQRGERVVATGRESDVLEALVAEFPGHALALRLDVADGSAAREAVNQAVKQFGRLDVVFNNAGYGHIGSVEELTDEELRRQLDVNLFGVIHVTRAALPHLRKQRRGHLVQMSSLNGIEGLPGGAYYTASKFAIEGFSESLAAEVAHLGIHVTIVEPGPFRTRFLDRSAKWAKPMPDYAESVGKSREMLRQLNGTQPGDPARAAQAIIEAVDADKPPLRLPLGRMAFEHIRTSLDAELAELDTWAELGMAADFPTKGGSSDQGPGGSRQPATATKPTQRAHEDLVRRAYTAFNDRKVDAGAARWWMLFVMAGMITASVALLHATASAAPSRAPHWVRCNKIYGSPLCISVIGHLDDQADISVWYSKNSGPERSVRLYLERCESAKTRALVAQGKVEAGGTIDGSKTRYIYRNSCWIGVMRVLNQRFVTGELLTRPK
jgi:NAD(P)-dependent dehydrogenase (short-subunit alcohol dehydrogenase family)